MHAAALAVRIGGATSYLHAPAEGLSQKEGELAEKGRNVVLEVMAGELDRGFWRAFKRDGSRARPERDRRSRPFNRYLMRR